MMLLKKTTYDKLVAKVNNIDISRFVLKTKYDTDKLELEKKVPDVTDFVKTAKLTDLENKIPDIGNLGTKTALTTVENKIHDVSKLVKKTDYNTKATEIEKKLTDHNHATYIDTSEFNKLVGDFFNARLAQANLITKTNFEAKLSNLNRKITTNKTKYLLLENELNNLKTFDSSYFIGKSHFEENDTQNYLVFQPIVRYFKVITNTYYVSSWESKGLSATTSGNSLTLTLNYYDDLQVRVKFTGSCLKQPKFTYPHKTIVNIYIVYELGGSTSKNNDPTLKNCLFGAVIFTKMLILISMGILVMELDLIEDQVFHFQVVDLVKMY